MKVKNNRYNKKLRYRTHHELNEDFTNYRLWFFWFAVAAVIIAVLGNLGFIYPSIKPFEFAIFLISMFYLFIVKPLIMRGKITAFYRRSYKGLSLIATIYTRVAMIATGKVLGTCLFYIVFTRDIDYIMELSQYLFHPFHRVYSTIAVAISLLLFFLMFYQDRYVTIREYSNEINYRIKELNFGLRSAVENFMAQKDKEYGIKEFNGMYYDYEEQKHQKENKKKIKEKSESEKNETLLRRSSRS